MSLLPDNWVETTFRDVTTYISRGKSPKYTEVSVLPVVNQKAVRWHGIQKEYLKYIHPDQIDQWTQERFIQEGDVLWNSTGTGTIGRACLVQKAHLTPSKVVDSHVTIIRPNKEIIDPRYLFAWIRSSEIQRAIADLATGSTNQIELPRSIIAELRLPLAPINEQKRIADKLDALLARVDACRERLDRVPQILKRFRQTVLVTATSGVLTEEWRETNRLTRNWSKARLAEIGGLGRGKSKHRPRNDPRLYDGPYPFIQTGDVSQSGGTIHSHTQTYSEFGLAQSKLWPAGTVCITIAANIADTAILSYPACFPDSVVGFIANPLQCLPQFVKWSIDVIRTELEAFAPATAQKNINLAVLNNVEFELPPLVEQHEIVRRVETLFAFADRLEERYTAAHAQVENMTPALLAKAFCGELVPQDPNDEPASELLERILASKSSELIKPKRKASGRKPVTMKITIETVKMTIQQMSQDHFSFEELRNALPGNYESLKDAVFALLNESKTLRQFFDPVTQSVRFKRLLQ